MRFLIDAQLPRRLADELVALGAEAIHTLDLPLANRTTDAEVVEVAEREGRIVATKDVDFVDGHLLRSRPDRLLLISTGNISNRELIDLVRRNWERNLRPIRARQVRRTGPFQRDAPRLTHSKFSNIADAESRPSRRMMKSPQLQSSCAPWRRRLSMSSGVPAGQPQATPLALQAAATRS